MIINILVVATSIIPMNVKVLLCITQFNNIKLFSLPMFLQRCLKFSKIHEKLWSYSRYDMFDYRNPEICLREEVEDISQWIYLTINLEFQSTKENVGSIQLQKLCENQNSVFLLASHRWIYQRFWSFVSVKKYSYYCIIVSLLQCY